VNKSSPSSLLIREQVAIKQGRHSRNLIRTRPNAPPTAMSHRRVSPRRGRIEAGASGSAPGALPRSLSRPRRTSSHPIRACQGPQGPWVAAHQGFTAAAAPGRRYAGLVIALNVSVFARTQTPRAPLRSHATPSPLLARARTPPPPALRTDRRCLPCSRTTASDLFAHTPLTSPVHFGSLRPHASAVTRLRTFARDRFACALHRQQSTGNTCRAAKSRQVERRTRATHGQSDTDRACCGPE
jgi:hypothetical protein